MDVWRRVEFCLVCFINVIANVLDAAVHGNVILSLLLRCSCRYCCVVCPALLLLSCTAVRDATCRCGYDYGLLNLLEVGVISLCCLQCCRYVALCRICCYNVLLMGWIWSRSFVIAAMWLSSWPCYYTFVKTVVATKL